jgi:hypothetical protein
MPYLRKSTHFQHKSRASSNWETGFTMSHGKGKPLLGTEVGQPVPGEDAFDAHDEIAMALRNGAGAAFMVRCSKISPA